VEGCHTDTEREDLSDGNATPLVIRTISATSQQDSQPKDNSFPPCHEFQRKNPRSQGGAARPRSQTNLNLKSQEFLAKRTRSTRVRSPRKSLCPLHRLLLLHVEVLILNQRRSPRLVHL